MSNHLDKKVGEIDKINIYLSTRYGPDYEDYLNKMYIIHGLDNIGNNDYKKLQKMNFLIGEVKNYKRKSKYSPKTNHLSDKDKLEFLNKQLNKLNSKKYSWIT
jgi:hypothetical protein